MTRFLGLIAYLFVLLPLESMAAADADVVHASTLGATGHFLGITALILFILAYVFVMSEEFSKLRKSKPTILAATLIWPLIAIIAANKGVSTEEVNAAFQHNLTEVAELMLFLLVAMTYINTMTELNVFGVLRSWLIKKGFSYRKLFWITGTLAFFISPVADNLTTALLMGAVVLAVGANSPKFVSLSFINIVVAANAGGAYSPFGDITTLMVWQAGKAQFFDFFSLFIPSVVNYVVPAAMMHFAVPDESPQKQEGQEVEHLKRGAKRVATLFLLTIVTAVCFKQFLGLPPFMGMMLGFVYLGLYGFYLKKTGEDFDVFDHVSTAEWDTLLFFFGVIFCVGGLGYIGYLEFISHHLYDGLGPTQANIIIGGLSSVVDNIPLMFAVLTMDPNMGSTPHDILAEWLLITLTAGVGGSILSIGSAAGVGLMGQSKGKYTFFGHLKWTPAIIAGYLASIIAHLWIQGELGTLFG